MPTKKNFNKDYQMSKKFKVHQVLGTAELRPYEPGESMEGITVAEVDRANGSPKEGDMIRRNPSNHSDQWLVSKAYYEASFMPMHIEAQPDDPDRSGPTK